MNEQGDLVSAVFGDVPFEEAPRQSSRDGEDYAMRMVTCDAEFPMAFWSDCCGRIGAANAKCRATAAKGTNAHFWGHFHECFEGEDLEVRKTKGHATAKDILEGTSSHCSLWMALGHLGGRTGLHLKDGVVSS